MQSPGIPLGCRGLFISINREFTEILYRRPIFFWRQRRHPLEEAAELGGGGKAQIVRYFRDRLLG